MMHSPGLSVVIWLVSGLVALILMEFWAAFLHRRVWHGWLWSIHKSHHEPRAGRFELNDILSSTHAPVAAAMILYGCLGAPSVLREVVYGWGFGMTAFGLLYLTFHDGLMHGRLPVAALRRVPYFQLLCDAHQIHHEKNGGPYGFFRVPPRLRAVIARRAQAASDAPAPSGASGQATGLPVRPGPPLLYLATAGGLALTTRSLLGHTLPLSAALGCLGGYLGLIALGVAFPQLQMWGEAISSGSPARGVALTFDDGPHPVHTRAVAKQLRRFQARATFFVIGEKAVAHPDVLLELIEDGHEIGVHSHQVDRLLSLRSVRDAHDDLRRCVEAIERITKKRPTLFRPPCGLTTPRILEASSDLDLDLIAWSARALDGLARTTGEQVRRRVIPALRGGAIICLHDAPERGDRTPVVIDELPAILSALHERNLPAVTVSELLAS